MPIGAAMCPLIHEALNVLGRAVGTTHSTLAHAEFAVELEIPVTDLTPGVYFLTIQTASGRRGMPLTVVR